MKKYRLKIKWPIAENELNLALFIRQNDEENTIIDSSRIDNFYKGTGIPKSWLTQIEAKGPLGFEKWNDENQAKNNKMMTAYDHRKLGWNACLKYARGLNE